MTRYLATLFLFYRRNLRVQPVRELMAIGGIAAGVALLFTVQVAHRSITGSFEQIASGFAGKATLEVAARGPSGFSAPTSREIGRLPGVLTAAPIVQQPAVVVGPSGRRALTLVGATADIARLGGTLTTKFLRAGVTGRFGTLVLTESTADAIGAQVGSQVSVEAHGEAHRARVRSVVSNASLGSAAGIPVAAVPLPIVQSWLGDGRALTRVLVEPEPRRSAGVQALLTSRFGQTLNVRPTSTEGRLLSNVASPEREITFLFSAISIVAGVILAYAALLLASDERRRFVVYLVEIGTPDSIIIGSLVFDALLLGLLGSVVGVVVGDGISLIAYREIPGYITAAFPVGGARIIDSTTVLIAFAGGMVAALVAAALPALSVLRASASAEPEAVGRSLSFAGRTRVSSTVLLAVGAVVVAGSVLACLLAPGITVVGLVSFCIGLVFCLPALTGRILRLSRGLARRSSDPSAQLSAAELRRTPTRSVALLATGLIATFLTVTIGGSVADVQRAVRSGAAGLLSGAELWIKPGGPENVYTTQPFSSAPIEANLKRLPGVASVQAWQDSFLDLDTRRIWVVGVPPDALNQVVPSQLVAGSRATANARLRAGGWVAMSDTIAKEDHVGLGAAVTLPTPTGRQTFRVAALIANYGWLSGAIVMSARDHARYWNEADATQLGVRLTPGLSMAQGEREVRAALPPGQAAIVESSAERRREASDALGNTLARLNDTTLVVLIAAVAAVLALIVGAISQRRARLDALLAIGMGPGQFSRLIFYESGLPLIAGSLVGLVAGLLGQSLVDKWLRHTTGAPVQFAAAWQIGLRTFLIAAGIALLASILAASRTYRSSPLRAVFSSG